MQVNSGAVVAVTNEAVTNIAHTPPIDGYDPFNMDETNVRTLEWEGEAASWMLKSSVEGTRRLNTPGR